MDKKRLLLNICLCSLGILAGTAAASIKNSRTAFYVPPLKVIGDVKETVTLQNPDEMGRLENITFQGENYRAAKLSDIIGRAKPEGLSTELYMTSSDGFTAVIKKEETDACYVSFSSRDGWTALNLRHPVSSNVKMLQEIVVVSDDAGEDYGFNIIGRDSVLAKFTPGRLYTGTFGEYPYFEGKASSQNAGKTYEASIYTRRRVFRLGDVTEVQNKDMVLVMGENGEYRMADSDCLFEIKDNYISYIHPDTRDKIDRVKGVIVNPPSASIMDIYYDSLHYLENGERVLVALADGFTYSRYEYAVANGYAPFLAGSRKAAKASGVFPIRCNTAMASAITGKPPEENGVALKDNNSLKIPSIIAEATRMKKQPAYLEGGETPINAEIQAVEAIDKNTSGSTDDELKDMAVSESFKNRDLLIIHFHGIGDRGEHYGELSRETMKAVSDFDRYMAEIAEKWQGRVILAGSQGIRSGAPPGLQADFNSDSMFMPYLLLK